MHTGSVAGQAKALLSRRARWLTVAVILTAAALAAWALVSGRQRDPVWERIQARGVFTVATDASYPPFADVDGNGALYGFDIDLAQEIARRWGVRAEFENIAYDALLSTLTAGRDDAVISAFVPQPARMAEVAFTRSYFVAGIAAVVPAGQADPEALRADPPAWAAGKTLAVEYGSAGDALARQWARRAAGIQLQPMPTSSDALQAVADGRAQAALADAVSAYLFMRGNAAVELAGPLLAPEPYSIAVNLRSRELFRQLEQALQEMETDGTLGDLRAKWFGDAARP